MENICTFVGRKRSHGNVAKQNGNVAKQNPMENTSVQEIKQIIASQRTFFASDATRDISFRRKMLKTLLAAIQKWEKPLCDALWQDMHKSYEEAYLTEISILYGEIRQHLKHLRSWTRKQSRPTPLKLFPSRSYVQSMPLGCSLIIAPWNYPVQLLLNPLVGAISSGCTAILKPSPYVPSVAKVLGEMISESFRPEYVAIVQGNREVNQALLAERHDLIFFTGSPVLGKQVMRAAAEHLTPVVLELGGKSPCIVDKDADIQVAAKRIAWGKTLNCGQTCIAPDYLILHASVKEAFIKAFAQQIKQLHGDDIAKSPHYVRMVNQKAYQRVSDYLSQGKLRYGGRTEAEERFIEAALLDEVSPESPVMQEEIFGPVFPIITFDEATDASSEANSAAKKSFADQVVDFVNAREHPLAFYYFGNEKRAWKVLERCISGGACINDTIMHIANEKMTFGGVGHSGMGAYHGRKSFEVFSHQRSVIATGTWIDLPFRYMPYKLFKLAKKLI